MRTSSPSWHVGPAVDLTAYAFSWAVVLLPLTLLPGRASQIVLLLLVVGLTFAHRHYTLPYVYLDRETFAEHRHRLTWFPLAMLVAFAATPFLWSTRARVAVAGVFVVAGAWNVWHVYMQKYGILRLYAAKSEDRKGRPPWVDRLFVFAWIPLYLVWLAPSYRAEVGSHFPSVASVVTPLLDLAQSLRTWLLIPAVALVATSFALFASFETRAAGPLNRARLGMAIGTTGLSASFLLFHPVHVFMAFAFSHAVEYMVFVWAFQRRRYGGPSSPASLLGRLLRKPWIAYAAFTVGITAPYLLARFYGYLILPSAANPVVLGTTIERWAFYWSVYQSMVHFYFDGFLWKMSRPATLAHF